jgi:hypothetical protein
LAQSSACGIEKASLEEAFDVAASDAHPPLAIAVVISLDVADAGKTTQNGVEELLFCFFFSLTWDDDPPALWENPSSSCLESVMSLEDELLELMMLRGSKELLLECSSTCIWEEAAQLLHMSSSS